MYKTCKDIEGSLYVAPNEIRACCQRFFYKGEIRGDAQLITIKDGQTPTNSDLLKARKKIFEQIQKNEKKACNGCRYLYEVKEKPKFTSEVKHLSIEHHAVCNLRCTYCSDVYYDGKRSKYNVVEFISYLSKNNSFKNCNQVVWGGGEPTLDKSFELILEEIEKEANPKLYHRVFTNSVRYSQAVDKFLKKGLIKIVTSVDAGTPEKFKEVRGRPRFYNVFENLQKYASVDPSKITIKYIFTENNRQKDELQNFVEKCLEYNLQNCNFQISMNYKKEILELEMLKSISFLFGKLFNNGIKKIFLDDHVMARFVSLNDTEILELIKYLNENNIDNILIDSKKIDNLIIYGAGNIGEEIINKTNFFKLIKNYDVIDSDKKKIGSYINKKKIQPPEILKNDKRMIYISAAQAYDEVFKAIVSIKGNSKSIITGLII